MFKIYDGRSHFYQWDIDRKLIVEDASISEVHFCNQTDNYSLVCKTYIEDGLNLVNVPNILLQNDWRINVYAYDSNYTKFSEQFDVIRRCKPEDYVYTETEILNYNTLSDRITKIEEGGGITPTIGDNGNWYLGSTDTGKPSRGEKGETGAQGEKGADGATGATGADGKSAYSYAQDGGYTGTEEEFAAKLAAEKLPNPYPLTFTGAVSGSYDGSSAKTITIPSGGGGAASGLCIYDNYDVALISFAQIDQATLPIDAGIEITTDDNGNPFSYDGLVVWTDIKSGISYTDIDFNNVKNCHYPIQHGVKDSMNMYIVDGTSMQAIVGHKSCVYIRQTREDIDYAFFPASNIAQLPEKFTAIHLCPRNKVASGTFYKIWGLTKK